MVLSAGDGEVETGGRVCFRGGNGTAHGGALHLEAGGATEGAGGDADFLAGFGSVGGSFTIKPERELDDQGGSVAIQSGTSVMGPSGITSRSPCVLKKVLHIEPTTAVLTAGGGSDSINNCCTYYLPSSNFSYLSRPYDLLTCRLCTPSSLSSGSINFTTGAATGTTDKGDSGLFCFRTGDAVTGRAGGIKFSVGYSSSGAGGDVELQAGTALGGNGGALCLCAGSGTAGGSVTLASGSGKMAEGGDPCLASGASAACPSGEIQIQSGDSQAETGTMSISTGLYSGVLRLLVSKPIDVRTLPVSENFAHR